MGTTGAAVVDFVFINLRGAKETLRTACVVVSAGHKFTVTAAVLNLLGSFFLLQDEKCGVLQVGVPCPK